MATMEELAAQLAAAEAEAEAAALPKEQADKLAMLRKIEAARNRRQQAEEDARELLTTELLDEAKAKYQAKNIGAVYVEGPGDGIFLVCSADKKTYDHMVKLIEQKKATPSDTRSFALACLLRPDPKENDVHAMMDAFPRLADTLANEALELSGAKNDQRSKRR